VTPVNEFAIILGSNTKIRGAIIAISCLKNFFARK